MRTIPVIAAAALVLAGCGGDPGDGAPARNDATTTSVASDAPALTTKEPTACDYACSKLLQQVTTLTACVDAGGSLCLSELTDVHITADGIRDDPSQGYGVETQKYAFNQLIKGKNVSEEIVTLRCYQESPDDAECADLVQKAVEHYEAGAKALATGIIPS